MPHVITNFTVPASRACVGGVRNTLADALAGLSLTGDQVDVVRLCVSELATNAMLHGVGEDDSVAMHVKAVASRETGVLRITVSNPCRSRTVPSVRDDVATNTSAETGRGLFIVQSQAAAYGADLLVGGDGALWCAAWFELEVDLSKSLDFTCAAAQSHPLPAVEQSALAHPSRVRRAVGRLPGSASQIARWRPWNRTAPSDRAA